MSSSSKGQKTGTRTDKYVENTIDIKRGDRFRNRQMRTKQEAKQADERAQGKRTYEVSEEVIQ